MSAPDCGKLIARLKMGFRVLWSRQGELDRAAILTRTSLDSAVLEARLARRGPSCPLNSARVAPQEEVAAPAPQLSSQGFST